MYYENDALHILPTIWEMYEYLKSRYENLKKIDDRIVHGDFHPPNILFSNQQEIHIVDLADVNFSDNPCWDFGKWQNFIKRFYRIVPIRMSQSYSNSNTSIEYKIVNNRSIYIKDTYQPSLRISEVDKKSIEIFSQIIGNSHALIQAHTYIAELAVNILTLRRHSLLYPRTVKYILPLICESYIQLKEYE
jgi:hypothetical protein